jgi:hypothetical protein
MGCMSTATDTPTSPKSPRVRRALWVTIAISVAAIIVALIIIWLGFKAKAEGLAVGYLQAASSAHQMGRPIPDTIFETGLYRVQVVTQGGTNQVPVVITVYVKDRILNQTFFEESRAISPTTGR